MEHTEVDVAHQKLGRRYHGPYTSIQPRARPGVRSLRTGYTSNPPSLQPHLKLLSDTGALLWDVLTTLRSAQNAFPNVEISWSSSVRSASSASSACKADFIMSGRVGDARTPHPVPSCSRSPNLLSNCSFPVPLNDWRSSSSPIRCLRPVLESSPTPEVGPTPRQARRRATGRSRIGSCTKVNR